jgi:hypothetical protein
MPHVRLVFQFHTEYLRKGEGGKHTSTITQLQTYCADIILWQKEINVYTHTHQQWCSGVVPSPTKNITFCGFTDI